MTDPTESAATTPLARRQRLFVWAVGIAAVISVFALLVSTMVKSPAQKAAEVAPPAASVITAPLESKVLRATVATRGTVVVGKTIPVVGLAATPDQSRIVTAVAAKPGAKVRSGALLAQVSGRPIFLLAGKVPAYRNLVPGTVGPDVAQLRAALKALGYSTASDPRSRFGRATQAAVARFYRAAGFTALTTRDLDAGEAEQLQAARASVRQAVRALQTAKYAVQGTSGAARTEAKRQVGYAADDLRIATDQLGTLARASGVVFPLAELVFSPMPVAVGTVTSDVGTDLATASSSVIMTLKVGQPRIQVRVPQGSQVGLKEGAAASITDDVNAVSADGSVASVGGFEAATQADPNTGAAGQDAGYPVVITTTKPLAATWLGRDVRVEIAVASTTSAVLTVPEAALVTSPDNTTWVTILGPNQTQRMVKVSTGLEAGGEVQVTADDGTLAVGDQVVIG